VKTLHLKINPNPLKHANMEIECENCGGLNWILTIYEMREMGRTVTYSALKCKGCKMTFPLQELAKNVKKETVVSKIRKRLPSRRTS